jgi:hypothetical protein
LKRMGTAIRIPSRLTNNIPNTTNNFFIISYLKQGNI